MENQLVPVQQQNLQQGLKSLEEVKQFASICIESGLFPNIKKPEEAIMLIIAGKSLGLNEYMSMNKLFIVRGKIGMSGEVATMLLQRNGYKIEGHFDNEDNPTACEITLSRPDKGSFTWRFTKTDAERAQLLKPESGHERFPKDVWWYRALLGCARKFAPEALGGMGYLKEELESIPEPTETEKPKEVKPATPISETKKTDRQLSESINEIMIEKCIIHDVQWILHQKGKFRFHIHENKQCYLRLQLIDIANKILNQYKNKDAFELKTDRFGKNKYYQTTEFKALIPDWADLEEDKKLYALAKLENEFESSK